MEDTKKSAAPNSLEAQQAAKHLQSQCSSLLLSTVNEGGLPEISYAPFIEDQNRFYIFISGLAAHTKNLLDSGIASVMFIEEESQADHIFSRKRLTYRCSAAVISRNSEHFNSILGQFQNNFGTLIQTLRSLSDFQLFELTPDNGRYIAGFGKTFEIEVSGNQFHQLTEAGINNR